MASAMTEDQRKRVEYTFGEVKLERSNNTPSRKVLVYFPEENEKIKEPVPCLAATCPLLAWDEEKRLGSGGRREAASSGNTWREPSWVSRYLIQFPQSTPSIRNIHSVFSRMKFGNLATVALSFLFSN